MFHHSCAGSGSEGAQTNLQESYSDSFTLQEAEALALSTLKQVGGVTHIDSGAMASSVSSV